METNNKGGRPRKDKVNLIAKRSELIKILKEERWSNTDIALIFNIHPSQITRTK